MTAIIRLLPSITGVRFIRLLTNKVKTKRLANSININTPKMIGIIEHQYQVKNLLVSLKARYVCYKAGSMAAAAKASWL